MITVMFFANPTNPHSRTFSPIKVDCEISTLGFGLEVMVRHRFLAGVGCRDSLYDLVLGEIVSESSSKESPGEIRGCM
eukprot:1366585-Amorphochlora_amoeboformis.AAC.1